MHGPKTQTRNLRWLSSAALLSVTVAQPAAACSVPLRPMTSVELAGAEVAFVGEVVAIELRDEEITENWPDFVSCPWMLKMGMEVPACEDHPPVEAAIFRVEEPIRGIKAGGEYVVPQSGGADCGTYYTAGSRYVFGALGINGQVWEIGPDDTAAEAIAAHAK